MVTAGCATDAGGRVCTATISTSPEEGGGAGRTGCPSTGLATVRSTTCAPPGGGRACWRCRRRGCGLGCDVDATGCTSGTVMTAGRSLLPDESTGAAPTDAALVVLDANI